MLSLSSARVGDPGKFVWFKNFVKLWNDNIFWTAVWNTFWYTGVTTVFKLGLGLWLAMLLNRHFRGKAIVRAFILLPFIIPTVLSTFAWKWMFDPTFSVINWSLFKLGLTRYRRWVEAHGLGRYPADVVLANFEQHLDALAGRLERNTWLCGDDPSIADIAVAAQLEEVLATSRHASLIHARGELVTWLARCQFGARDARAA